MWALVIVAALGGVAVAVQAQLMGIMDHGMGTLESVFITYGVGAVAIGLIMAVYRGGNLGAWTTLPWFTLLSGICGLIIVGCIGFSAPRMGDCSRFDRAHRRPVYYRGPDRPLWPVGRGYSPHNRGKSRGNDPGFGWSSFAGPVIQEPISKLLNLWIVAGGK
jgi:hypothetical protein